MPVSGLNKFSGSSFYNNMAVSSWLYRRRLFRRGYAANREKREEKDASIFDPSKDEKENTLRILTNICRGQGLSDYQKISYLKALNKIVEQSKKNNTVLFMNNEHIFRCLKTCLTSKNTGVRSAGYRVIRNIVSTAEDVDILNDLQIPKLIVRSIDLGVTYEDERIQAFRLVVKILVLNPERFYIGVTRSLISLANNSGEVKDKMTNSSIVILCYLCILNPELLIQCYGQYVLLKCALEVSDPRLNESMLISLMLLMNKRNLREKADIHLDYVTHAYTEWEKKKRSENESKNPFKINELSVLAILRSWVGIHHFCQPNNSGIKVIVDVLHLHRDDLRKSILDLLYQIFGLDRKLWTDKLSVAIENIDPSKYHESWNINQRFVVAEGRDILPHKNFYRPNLTEVHTALVLYAFLKCGILSALVEVVVSPDAFLSIRALILLGVILHLSYKLLPTKIVDLGPGLPTLAEYITHGLPNQRSQALMAISALCKIHEVLKRKPTPKSLFLKQLVFYSNTCKNNTVESEISNAGDNEEIFDENNETQDENNGPEDEASELQDKLNFYFLQLEFERRNKKQEMRAIDQCINKSNVLWFSDYRDWDWNRIEFSLKSMDESFVRLQEAYYKNYIKKLIHFYKPSSKIYSEIEYSYRKKELDILTTTAFYLIDFLLQSDDGGKGKFLDDLLLDLSKELREVVVNESLYTIFFNPRHMVNTMCQHYFLIIGRLSSTDKGIKALNRRNLLKICTDIVCSCRHEYYVKLIVSSLNYNYPSRTRLILSKAVCSSVESVRIYATELLLVLARLDVQNFSKWGTDLLISLIYSEDKTIATTSINILQELCHDKVYLESLLETKPSVLHLVDKGNLLLVRFLSTQTGFLFLSKANYIESELLKWENEYNFRYVELIEDELQNALTLHEIRDYEKNFKRLTYNGYKHDDVFIPFHLYGELSKHERGFESLVRNGHIFKMSQNLQKRSCDSDLEILELKSSLWGLSNMSTSKLGFEFLDKENVIKAVVEIADSCPVLSVRATAFYCLSLISTTVPGADALEKFGWYSVRRNRSEEWPAADIRSSVLDDIRRCKLEAYESNFVPVASPSATDKPDSERVLNESHDINLNSSSEKSFTLAEKLLKKLKSSKKENVADSQFFERESEKCTTSSADASEERQGPSDSDTYLKKKDSSGNTSVDGSSEGNKKFRLRNTVSLKKLRSLYSNRNKVNSESDLKVQSGEEIHSQTESANTLSSSSSQSDLVSEYIQEIPTDKFELSYKGVSLPKSLSQIFSNAPKSDSDPNEQETSPSQCNVEILPSYLAEMKEVIEIEQDCIDSSRMPDASDDDAKSRALFPHALESCIGCCTKVRDNFVKSHPSASDLLKAENSNCDTENAIKMLSPPSEDPPVDYEVEQKLEDVVPAEETTEKSNESDAEMPKETSKGDEEQLNVYRIVVKQVMRQICRMFNPVICKSAKQELSLLKQRYPRVFRDVCVYSSVCNLLSSSSCRITSRYFIQQLFSDVYYSMVYDDAARALREYIPANTSSMADILPFILQSHSSPQKNVLPLELYKPWRIKTIAANPAQVQKKNSFDDVPVTYYTTRIREIGTQTSAADFLLCSSHY